MANNLKMEKKILIKQLVALGWSFRRIEKETGIHRETVSKYGLQVLDNHQDDDSSPSSSLNGSTTQNPDNSSGTVHSRSLSAKYNQIICDKLSQGLQAKRIYQDLVSEQGFSDSYDSVKRYVRFLKKTSPKVYARIHTPPGREAQVDFGKGAPTLRDGRWEKTWLFKMVLSHSRHSYEEAVWKQDVESFIRCHEHAFDSFGGVPFVIRLDNLKSGVLKASLYEPELNPAYASFARHAGFVPLPCLPRRPEHKGKVESGIGYTKKNALKGLKFGSLEEQNAHLRAWNQTWARTRIHGTTKRQVWDVFVKYERSALQPLPEKAFPYFSISTRTVHPDGHVEVDRAYYSVPHRFVGQKLIVHYNAEWVKVFSGTERVAYHRKSGPGHFQSDRSHLPQYKTFSQQEYTQKLLTDVRQIGSSCHKWATQALSVRGCLALRSIQGVIRLTGKYDPSKVDCACGKAITLNAYRYHTVKLLCEDSLDTRVYGPEKIHDLLQEHVIIRPLDQYDELVNSSFQNQE